ncbi:hypothetical protein AVEN_136963-1 [Araneus ventricosus]|uniref:Uncharacterized protein n=1 Tax=Araneus ventricosus TaxID=182803 RepID=A0A4Y2BHS5_ARAVE|nr:hypothetical protein AVEN_136963-1 [Araneus ventricosus]
MGGHEPGYGLLLVRLRRRIVNVSCLSNYFGGCRCRLFNLVCCKRVYVCAQLQWRVLSKRYYGHRPVKRFPRCGSVLFHGMCGREWVMKGLDGARCVPFTATAVH